MSLPYIARISLYPIKSLDAVDVKSASLLSSGALKFDREFAIFDQCGKFVNGKRNPKVHLVRCQFHLNDRTISLELPGSNSQQFHLDSEQNLLVAALSDFFGFPVTLQQNKKMGFPDDTDSPGPTIISTATLTEVASWFSGVSVDEMRRRIRANIEIGGVEAFWEDQLFAPDRNTVVAFRIGDVRVEGINPCQRCIVPTRDSLTGESYSNFQKIFISKRRETLPTWVAASRFNHFFRLSVNTKISASEVSKKLEIGSHVEILVPNV